MTPERKKPASERIAPATNRPSGVPRVVKRTTLRNEPKDETDSTVNEQVAALKKIPADRIGKNEFEVKAAETAARLREVQSENMPLASAAESARKETERYRLLYEKVAEEIKHANDARNESEKQKLEAGSRIDELQGEIQTLRKEISRGLHPEKRTEYLRIQPDQLAEMISDFEQAFSDSLTGLMLSNLELRLKVAVDTEEGRTVLLVPPVFKGKMRSDSINELIVRILPSGVMGIS